MGNKLPIYEKFRYKAKSNYSVMESKETGIYTNRFRTQSALAHLTLSNVQTPYLCRDDPIQVAMQRNGQLQGWELVYEVLAAARPCLLPR